MAAYTTINDPEAYFQVKLYTGDGDANAQTFDGDTDMQPDLCWGFHRSGTEGAGLWDSPRGALNRIQTHSSGSESSQTDSLVSFDSDGFTVGGTTANNDGINLNTGTFAMFCWNTQGGAGSSNTAGSINTTTTSVNTTSGLSISTYTDTGSAATIGHGLGAVPDIVIVKGRTIAASWRMYHSANNNTDYLTLSTTDYVVTSGSNWNDTTPTSTVFSLGTDAAINGSYNYVAYAWTSIQGFSKFSKYLGNGNANGPFVYTGFRPACVILKRSNAVRKWFIFNNKEQGFNPDNDPLFPNATDAEGGQAYVDFLSNGFKLYDDNDDINGSGDTYVYLAFAEAPFANTSGVPANAR